MIHEDKFIYLKIYLRVFFKKIGYILRVYGSKDTWRQVKNYPYICLYLKPAIGVTVVVILRHRTLQFNSEEAATGKRRPKTLIMSRVRLLRENFWL
jgi:hypothetical protein